MEIDKKTSDVSTKKSVKSLKKQIFFLQVSMIITGIFVLIQTSLIFLSYEHPLKARYINNVISFLWFPIFFILYYWQIEKPLLVVLAFLMFLITIIIMSSIHFMILKILGFVTLILILYTLKRNEKKNLIVMLNHT